MSYTSCLIPHVLYLISQHNIHNLPRHHNNLYDRHAFGPFFGHVALEGSFFDLFGGQADRQFKFEPDFPVEGNRIFDDILRQEGGVENGPGGNANASAVAVQRPEFFGRWGAKGAKTW